jgi:hypothetical protein
VQSFEWNFDDRQPRQSLESIVSAKVFHAAGRQFLLVWHFGKTQPDYQKLRDFDDTHVAVPGREGHETLIAFFCDWEIKTGKDFSKSH